jgi:hypothetical protein
MNELSQLPIGKLIFNISKSSELTAQAPVYRFDIFKGIQDERGKIRKLKSVGAAYLKEGFKTYNVHLKTFLKDKFFLLPNSTPENKSDFVILTREPAQQIKRKHFWNNIGEGRILSGENHGLMQLRWDVLVDDLYMALHPTTVSDSVEMNKADAA